MQAKEIRSRNDFPAEGSAGPRLKPGAAHHAIARMKQAIARAVRGGARSSTAIDDSVDDESVSGVTGDEITQKVLIPREAIFEGEGENERK
jgi:hypothetical protein